MTFKELLKILPQKITITCTNQEPRLYRDLDGNSYLIVNLIQSEDYVAPFLKVFYTRDLFRICVAKKCHAEIYYTTHVDRAFYVSFQQIVEETQPILKEIIRNESKRTAGKN